MTKVTSPGCCGHVMSLVGDSDAGYEFACLQCGRTTFVGKPKGPTAAPIPSKLAHKALRQAFGGRLRGKGTWLGH